jgi:hypothetical protein
MLICGCESLYPNRYLGLSGSVIRRDDLHRILTGLALVYGGGWFIPALLISDFLLLRRTLSRLAFARYISLVAVTALLVGLCMPGMLLMIGYPITAAAILGYGFLHRKKLDSPQVGVEPE